jgi:hypothetical protein
VFQPYQPVKDHRPGVISGNINAIMDGYIKQFIDAYLVAGSGMRRRNAVDSETAENVGQHASRTLIALTVGIPILIFCI